MSQEPYTMNPSLLSILKQYWGYDFFRPLQEDIIHSIIEGEDTLAVLPTGGGKSICFQVPALAKDGLCLVITPLIALMKDQVEKLQSKNINALSIVSGMSYSDIRKILQQVAFGPCKFLYVSPERLETKLFLEYLPALPINLIAVDEAHCISQWGYDFRPSYLKIANIRKENPGIPILALTASATKDVQADICDKLSFRNPKIIRHSFARANLSYSVFEVDSKINKLIDILNKVAGSAIVYCKSRRRTREIADLLKLQGIDAEYYHAGLTLDDRNNKQENWINGRTRLIVCTNAFGMGIDKPDVRTVVHVDAPDCLESYYQEAGRAGRDGKRAYAVLLFQKHENPELLQLAETRFPSPESVRIVYQALANYLQLPSGSGEDDFFEFDFNDFVKRFRLNTYQVIYSLQALQQEGIIAYHDQIFTPSSVLFTADKNYIADFEKNHPEAEALIKALLRSYGGIFDQPVYISEKQLAGSLKKGKDQISQELLTLHQYGIILYQVRKETPQIRFLQNRVRAEDLDINTSQYQKRKKAYEKRVEFMVSYILSAKECRSVLIGNYFGEESTRACGICDNCLKSKNTTLSPEEFTVIHNRLRDLLSLQPKTMNDLLAEMDKIKKEKVWELIDFLVAEERLVIDEFGRISLK